MKVIALKQGYFGKLLEVGETFEVPDDATASWFVPVEQAESAKPEGQDKPAKSKAKPEVKLEA